MLCFVVKARAIGTIISYARLICCDTHARLLSHNSVQNNGFHAKMRSGILKRISGNPKLSLEAVGESGFEKSLSSEVFFPLITDLRMCLRNLKSLGEVLPLDCLAMYALIWKRKRSTADSCSIVSLITLCVTLFVSQVSQRATIHVTQVGCALNPANNCTAKKISERLL